MSGRPWPRSSSPAPRTWPPARASAWSWSGSRWPTRSGRGRSPSPPTCWGRMPPRWWPRADVDVVVEVIGGLHPAHELIEAALRNGKPVVTANKALLAVAGAELAEVAAAAGRRPLVRGGGRRRHPRDPALARVTGRGADRPRHGDRQRHHELHPHPHGGRGRRAMTTSFARRRNSVWPSVTRRPTSTATTPRPRPPSSPRSRSAATSSTPTCTGRASAASARPTSPTPRRLGLLGQAARHRRADRRRARDVRAGAPGHGPQDAPPGLGARRLQRGLRRGRGER